MSDQSFSKGVVVGALILAVAVLGSAWLVSNSIKGASVQIRRLAANLDDPVPSARPGKPDPAKRYELEIAGSPAKGPADAIVTLVEYSDFQCPFCGRVTPTLEALTKKYPDQLRVVFKHMPLPNHSKAPAAHAAAEAAARQGRFWEMHDLIFANQRALDAATYQKYAEQLGLDMDRFEADRTSPEVRAKVQKDVDSAKKVGVTGTPSFFVNGRFMAGAQPVERFEALIDEELAKNEKK